MCFLHAGSYSIFFVGFCFTEDNEGVGILILNLLDCEDGALDSFPPDYA